MSGAIPRRWPTDRQPNPRGRVTRFDATDRRPVDKWTAAPRPTTSPQGQQPQQKRSTHMVHKPVNSECSRQATRRLGLASEPVERQHRQRDLLCRKCGKEVVYGTPGFGMAPPWCYLAQGMQHKSARREPWVWQGGSTIAGSADSIVVGEEIEVESARPTRDSARSAKAVFDVVHARKEFRGRMLAAHRDDAVDEPGLFRRRDWRAPVPTRSASERHANPP